MLGARRDSPGCDAEAGLSNVDAAAGPSNVDAAAAAGPSNVAAAAELSDVRAGAVLFAPLWEPGRLRRSSAIRDCVAGRLKPGPWRASCGASSDCP